MPWRRTDRPGRPGVPIGWRRPRSDPSVAPHRNFAAPPSDQMGMDCATARLAVSARLDGEGGDLSGELAPELVEAHLDGCADCRDWQDRARALTRAARVRTAPEVPDLSAAIMAAADLGPAARLAAARRQWAARIPVLRVALVALGLVHLLASLHSMVAGSAEPGSLHATHEVGA